MAFLPPSTNADYRGARIAVWSLGLAMLVVAIRYQTLTAFFLSLVIVERGLMALQGWVLAPPVSGHHPPEHYASLVAPPLALLFMLLAMRRTSEHAH